MRPQKGTKAAKTSKKNGGSDLHLLTYSLLVNSTFRISESEPDIECYVIESTCHDNFATNRINNHDPLVEAAFGNIILNRKDTVECDESMSPS